MNNDIKTNWAGCPKPRSASEAKTALFANESECITGRHPKGGKAVSVGEGRALQKWTAERNAERHVTGV